MEGLENQAKEFGCGALGRRKSWKVFRRRNTLGNESGMEPPEERPFLAWPPESR